MGRGAVPRVPEKVGIAPFFILILTPLKLGATLLNVSPLEGYKPRIFKKKFSTSLPHFDITYCNYLFNLNIPNFWHKYC